MNKNLECFARREERVTVGGTVFVARELATAADIVSLRDDADFSLKTLVMCVFMEDGVTPAFTNEDIPDIKSKTSMFRMSALVSAVQRVNGMDKDAEVKNSEAAPTGG